MSQAGSQPYHTEARRSRSPHGALSKHLRLVSVYSVSPCDTSRRERARVKADARVLAVLIRAFAFDLDETLVDCEPQHVRATRAMLEALGFPPGTARDVFHEVTGKRTRDIIDDFRRAAGASQDLDELLALRHSAFVAALDEMPARPMPGVVALLEECRARGPMAVVSSGYRDDILESLRSAGLAKHFDVVVTGEDVSEPKPHPEPYKVAASRLGMPVSDVLVFEDSSRGVASGVEAGCKVVAVPHARTTKPDAVKLAHVVLSSMEEALPLEALLARVQ